MAHVWFPPAATDKALGRPETATGTGEEVELPVPSWPLSPLPQQTTCPVPRTAHVWRSPAATDAPSERPKTETGTE
jgi:hypothetical protein